MTVITRKEVVRGTKNVELIGLDELRITKFVSTYNVTRQAYGVVSRKLLDEKLEEIICPLTEVTKEEIEKYRRLGTSSFVMKDGEKLYWCKIPVDVSFSASNIISIHKCASSGRECSRLLATSDKKGGCEKVRNHARFIERYPWINLGIETFNTKQDIFLVAICNHYERCKPHKHHVDEKPKSVLN